MPLLNPRASSEPDGTRQSAWAFHFAGESCALPSKTNVSNFGFTVLVLSGAVGALVATTIPVPPMNVTYCLPSSM